MVRVNICENQIKKIFHLLIFLLKSTPCSLTSAKLHHWGHTNKFGSFCYHLFILIFSFRLLHSKSKESDVQLKSLLDESIRQRKAGLPINIPIPKPQEITTASGSNVKGRETEKNLDRLKRDLNVILPPGT